jgi:hypothetical protein
MPLFVWHWTYLYPLYAVFFFNADFDLQLLIFKLQNLNSVTQIILQYINYRYHRKTTPSDYGNCDDYKKARNTIVS